MVDVHAEATSEKMAMGHFCDGRASLVVGTHTHVPTADAQILPDGTAYQSDAGRVRRLRLSVIGMDKTEPLQRFVRKDFFKAWGDTDARKPSGWSTSAWTRASTCSTAPMSIPRARGEEVLGAAIKARRNKVLISTKYNFRAGDGPNDVGSSRFHILKATDAALKRLGTDYIDLVQLHGFDAQTPPEEALSTFDALIRAGKIRYIGASNYSGWHLMKSLDVGRYGYPRYVAHQAYYSLIGRDYEWELSEDQMLEIALEAGLTRSRQHGGRP